MYTEGRIVDFLDKLASSAPEPGGGSAAALAASVGAALVSMVANLTVGKEKYADVQDKIAELVDASEGVRAKLQELVQKDTEVYGVLAGAFKMPRATDEEKAARDEAVQSARLQAVAGKQIVSDARSLVTSPVVLAVSENSGSSLPVIR